MDADHAASPNIGALLRDPFRMLITRLHAGLAQAGYPEIHPPHGNVFQYVGAGCRLTELAERAQMTKQAMAYLVAYLEARGYVERVRDPTDARGRIVRLTEAGDAVVRVAQAIIAQIEAEWAARIGAEQFRTLRELLAQLPAVAPHP
jgi:DNA-binding MarR family transcriptional regulator